MRLGLTAEQQGKFNKLFALSKLQAECQDEERSKLPLDVLNSQGRTMMALPRADVHQQGYWHRAVNVWILCPSTGRVLVGQRATGKYVDARRWTCACGRLDAGEHSMDAAVRRVAAEFNISAVPEQQEISEETASVNLIFMLRVRSQIEKGVYAGQEDNTYLDVYLATLHKEIPLEHLQLDVRDKQACKYIAIDELEMAFRQKSESFVIPSEEYSRKLIYYLMAAKAQSK